MQKTATLESEAVAEREALIPILFDARIERLVRAPANDERSTRTEPRTSLPNKRARYSYD